VSKGITVTLPILTFDERSFSPRFGNVFDAAWLEPYESVLCMLWKFVRINRPVTASLVAQISTKPVDGYAGVAPTTDEVHADSVARLLGVRPRVIRDSMPDLAGTHLAWCPSCLNVGYHSVVHQLDGRRSCPIHGSKLRRECSSCGSLSAYRLDPQLLDGPFRCRHCRAWLCSSACPSWLGRPRLRPWQRMAITRARWGAQ